MAINAGLERLDCRTCTYNQKIERGCEHDSPIEGAWLIGDYSFNRCPLKVINRQSVSYLEAYKLFKLGYLPNSGGWLQQSKKFLDAMLFIDGEVKQIEVDNARERRT